MNLEFSNSDYVQYMLSISKETRNAVFRNILKVNNFKGAMKQISSSTRVNLTRLSPKALKDSSSGLSGHNLNNNKCNYSDKNSSSTNNVTVNNRNREVLKKTVLNIENNKNVATKTDLNSSIRNNAKEKNTECSAEKDCKIQLKLIDLFGDDNFIENTIKTNKKSDKEDKPVSSTRKDRRKSCSGIENQGSSRNPQSVLCRKRSICLEDETNLRKKKVRETVNHDKTKEIHPKNDKTKEVQLKNKEVSKCHKRKIADEENELKNTVMDVKKTTSRKKIKFEEEKKKIGRNKPQIENKKSSNVENKKKNPTSTKQLKKPNINSSTKKESLMKKKKHLSCKKKVKNHISDSEDEADSKINKDLFSENPSIEESNTNKDKKTIDLDLNKSEETKLTKCKRILKRRMSCVEPSFKKDVGTIEEEDNKKKNSCYIHFGELLEEIKKSKSKKYPIFPEKKELKTEFTNLSYTTSQEDIFGAQDHYKSIIVIPDSENELNKLIVKRTHHMEEAKILSRRHSFHFEDLQIKEEPDDLVPKIEKEDCDSLKQINNTKENSLEKAASQVSAIKPILKNVNDSVNTKPQQVNIDDVFPSNTGNDANVLRLEIQNEKSSSSVQVTLDKTEKDLPNISLLIDRTNENQGEHNKDNSLTEEALCSVKKLFVSLLYIYTQHCKMMSKVTEDKTSGCDPNINYKKTYSVNRRDCDIRKLYNELIAVKVAEFSLIRFFTRLIEVLQEEFANNEVVNETSIIYFIRHIIWTLLENFTSPSDENCLFNHITSCDAFEFISAKIKNLITKFNASKIHEYFNDFDLKMATNDHNPISSFTLNSDSDLQVSPSSKSDSKPEKVESVSSLKKSVPTSITPKKNSSVATEVESILSSLESELDIANISSNTKTTTTVKQVSSLEESASLNVTNNTNVPSVSSLKKDLTKSVSTTASNSNVKSSVGPENNLKPEVKSLTSKSAKQNSCDSVPPMSNNPKSVPSGTSKQKSSIDTSKPLSMPNLDFGIENEIKTNTPNKNNNFGNVLKTKTSIFGAWKQKHTKLINELFSMSNVGCESTKEVKANTATKSNTEDTLDSLKELPVTSSVCEKISMVTSKSTKTYLIKTANYPKKKDYFLKKPLKTYSRSGKSSSISNNHLSKPTSNLTPEKEDETQFSIKEANISKTPLSTSNTFNQNSLAVTSKPNNHHLEANILSTSSTFQQNSLAISSTSNDQRLSKTSTDLSSKKEVKAYFPTKEADILNTSSNSKHNSLVVSSTSDGQSFSKSPTDLGSGTEVQVLISTKEIDILKTSLSTSGSSEQTSSAISSTSNDHCLLKPSTDLAPKKEVRKIPNILKRSKSIVNISKANSSIMVFEANDQCLLKSAVDLNSENQVAANIFKRSLSTPTIFNQNSSEESTKSNNIHLSKLISNLESKTEVKNNSRSETTNILKKFLSTNRTSKPNDHLILLPVIDLEAETEVEVNTPVKVSPSIPSISKPNSLPDRINLAENSSPIPIIDLVETTSPKTNPLLNTTHFSGTQNTAVNIMNNINQSKSCLSVHNKSNNNQETLTPLIRRTSLTSIEVKFDNEYDPKSPNHIDLINQQKIQPSPSNGIRVLENYVVSHPKGVELRSQPKATQIQSASQLPTYDQCIEQRLINHLNNPLPLPVQSQQNVTAQQTVPAKKPKYIESRERLNDYLNKCSLPKNYPQQNAPTVPAEHNNHRARNTLLYDQIPQTIYERQIRFPRHQQNQKFPQQAQNLYPNTHFTGYPVPNINPFLSYLKQPENIPPKQTRENSTNFPTVNSLPNDRRSTLNQTGVVHPSNSTPQVNYPTSVNNPSYLVPQSYINFHIQNVKNYYSQAIEHFQKNTNAPNQTQITPPTITQTTPNEAPSNSNLILLYPPMDSSSNLYQTNMMYVNQVPKVSSNNKPTNSTSVLPQQNQNPTTNSINSNHQPSSSNKQPEIIHPVKNTTKHLVKTSVSYRQIQNSTPARRLSQNQTVHSPVNVSSHHSSETYLPRNTQEQSYDMNSVRIVEEESNAEDLRVRASKEGHGLKWPLKKLATTTVCKVQPEVNNQDLRRNSSRDSGYHSPLNSDQDTDDLVCENCCGPATFICSGCHTAYCSVKCQDQAWPLHQKKCYTVPRNVQNHT